MMEEFLALFLTVEVSLGFFLMILLSPTEEGDLCSSLRWELGDFSGTLIDFGAKGYFSLGERGFFGLAGEVTPEEGGSTGMRLITFEGWGAGFCGGLTLAAGLLLIILL
jgi:hypothetical protein